MWIAPAEAARRHDAGELLMMPPTVTTLRALAPYRTAAEALEAADVQDMTPVLAQARLEGDELVLTWPGHDEFTSTCPRRAGEAVPHDRRSRPSGQPRGAVVSGPATARAVTVLAPNRPR